MASNARAAAFEDPRFPKLTREEWPRCAVEVSLLSAPKPIRFADEADLLAQIRAGEDGLILECDGKRATFLPQVWEGLPDKRAVPAGAAEESGPAGATRGSRAAGSRATGCGNSSDSRRSPESSYPGAGGMRCRDGRIQCDLCPRDCRLHEGQRGLCFVRKMEGGRMVLTTYGRSSGFCVDPIEKKPLNQFYPGTSVLSFGTAGCNLACKFCQNWDISKSREMDRLMDEATPEMIAAAALRLGCKSVAFTYNDPVIFAEYAMDIADACHARGVKTVAVTAGYMHDAPRREFYAKMDAANVDLKAFTEDFYFKLTAARTCAGARDARVPGQGNAGLDRDHHAADSRARTIRTRNCAPNANGSCSTSGRTCRCISPPSIRTGR